MDLTWFVKSKSTDFVAEGKKTEMQTEICFLLYELGKTIKKGAFILIKT